MNYNRIILIGRMVNDPELKYTPSGIAVTQFRLAVNRPLSQEARNQGTQEQADFIDISTWRQSAEYAAQYLNKGRLVLVEGRLQIRDYVDKEGQKRKAAEVVADTVKGLDRREQGEGDAAASGGAGGQQYARSGGNAQYGGGGGGGEYDQTPREVAPVAAPTNRSGGGGGNYNGGSSAPRPAAPNRNAPPANNYNDNADGFDDPFAE